MHHIMPQRKTQRALRPGSRVRLHGHVWRVQSVTEVDAGPGRTLKESAAGYAVAAAAAASPGDVPWCVVVGGPNGAGKTTFALEYLPRYAACHEFVNPDLIAGSRHSTRPRLECVPGVWCWSVFANCPLAA